MSSGRVDLPDGRFVRLRPVSGNDMIALSRADLDLEGTMARLAAAVVEQSWEGDFLDLPWETLRGILRDWRTVSEDVALPPDPGESSP